MKRLIPILSLCILGACSHKPLTADEQWYRDNTVRRSGPNWGAVLGAAARSSQQQAEFWNNANRPAPQRHCWVVDMGNGQTWVQCNDN